MSPNTRPFRLVSIGLAATAMLLGACSSSSPETGSDSGFATEVSCDAMDAAGEGPCFGHFGFAWNGSQCVGISGCSCVGSDCSNAYPDPAVCEAEHTTCAGSASCDAMDAQGEGPCFAHFGFAWNGSQCVGISGCSCVGSDCSDAYTDPEVCEAEHTTCAGSTSCDAMDAQGQGVCSANFGVAWDGSQCVSINGCSCVGSDCSNTYPDPAACEADHAGC